MKSKKKKQSLIEKIRSEIINLDFLELLIKEFPMPKYKKSG